MALKTVRIWFDREGDFLEVNFDSSKPGYFRQTADDRVMERIDADGHVIGFSILGVGSLTTPLPVELVLN
jgi:hypothetical protein